MDIKAWKEHIQNGIGKYKYVWIVLICGIVIMMLPNPKVSAADSIDKMEEVINQQDLSEQLSDVLSNIHGAGKVQVMLSIAEGEKTIYQTDSTYSDNGESKNTKVQTILITDSDRKETGLIHQKNPPIYMGAVVIAQGADDPSIKLAIVDAVTKATGLGADKISVLKMK